MSNKFGFSVWPWMRQEGVIRRLTKEQAIQEYAGRVLVFDVANATFGRPTEFDMNTGEHAYALVVTCKILGTVQWGTESISHAELRLLRR